MTATKQSDFITAIRVSFDEAEAIARRLKETYSSDLFTVQPEAGKWSAGQHIGHLVTALTVYDPLFEDGISAAEKKSPPAPAQVANNPIRHGGLAKFLFFALNPEKPRNVPAPKKFHAASNAGVEQVDQFLEHLDQLRGYLDRSEGYCMSKNKMANPVIPVLKLHLCDAFQVHAWHSVRHLQASERILSQVAQKKAA